MITSWMFIRSTLHIPMRKGLKQDWGGKKIHDQEQIKAPIYFMHVLELA